VVCRKCSRIVAGDVADALAAASTSIAAATGIATGSGVAQATSKRRRSKLGQKRAQEEALLRIDKAYPKGVGDRSTSEVARKIGMKWHTTNRALGREGKRIGK
jgi:hypothetical protein